MDKTMIGLLSGASALAVLSGAAEAAVPVDGVGGIAPARSFAELLEPIPNAANILRAETEQRPGEGVAERPLVLAQYYYHHHHHHHHHYYHHHHHHHYYHHHYYHHHYYY